MNSLKSFRLKVYILREKSVDKFCCNFMMKIYKREKKKLK